MRNKSPTKDLKKEIIIFRKKLNDLLETQGPNSAIVLEVSRKLDLLIVEYYNSKEASEE